MPSLPFFLLEKGRGGRLLQWISYVPPATYLPRHITRVDGFRLFYPDIVDMSKMSADQRRRLMELAVSMSEERNQQQTPPRFADDYDRSRPADAYFRLPPLAGQIMCRITLRRCRILIFTALLPAGDAVRTR